MSRDESTKIANDALTDFAIPSQSVGLCISYCFEAQNKSSLKMGC